MSLFTVTDQTESIVYPQKVNINGEIVGSFFSGKIEMTFTSNSNYLDSYTVLIGQSSSSNLCLHDFEIMLDNNPFFLQITEKEEAKKNFNENKDDNCQTVFGIGNDSYASLTIPYILPNQLLTISAKFDLPIYFPTKNSFEIFFPLTCPSNKNDILFLSTKFLFNCKFNSLPIKSNSVQSNPDGILDLKTSTYSINQTYPNFSYISITYDLNPPTISSDIDKIQITSSKNLFDYGIASYFGQYGSVTFIPSNGQEESHFGEEFILVVDCSGSMRGTEIELAAECLIFFIKSLPENCFFNVVRFGSKFIPLFPKPVPYTNENAQKALDLAFSLEANLKGTVLSDPLSYVFSNPLSRKNKKRHVFVLTDGRVFDPKQVINLVKKNPTTTICNAIGIGYAVDRKMVVGISESGNGYCDFVLSGDDMRAKVINQLSKNLEFKYSKADIKIENHSDLQIVPPLSSTKLAPNDPVTFYFKSSKNFENKTSIRIDVEGYEKPIIIQMNSLPQESIAKQSLESLFNNENLKILRNLDQTDDVIRKIIQLSIKSKILSPYTALIGKMKYSSTKEKERMKKLIDDCIKSSCFSEDLLPDKIGFKTCTGKFIVVGYDPTDTTELVMARIQDKEGVPPEYQEIFFAGQKLILGNCLQDYNIKAGSIFRLKLNLLGGGFGGPESQKKIVPQRTFYSANTKDLVSIVAEQQIEGCWSVIPDFLRKNADMKIREVVQKIQHWAKNKQFHNYEAKVIGTVACLVYIVRYKKEFHQIWELIYEKALKWLTSINKSIQWDAIIKSL